MKIVYGLVVMMVLMVFIAACEDDETIYNTYYDTDSTKVLAIGEVVLRPSVDFRLNFLQLYAQPNTIDSVVFADTLVPVEQSSYYANGNELNYRANYYNVADSLRLQSGGIALVEIYYDDTITSVEVPLLMSPDDSVVFDFATTDTVVSLGEPVTLVWDEISGADWYGMMVYNYYDSLGLTYSRSWYLSTEDTTYTFPSSDHPDDSRYELRIIAVTGPVPDQGVDNLSGPGLVGTIYCATRFTHLSARVGQGVDHGVAGQEDLDHDKQSIVQKLCLPQPSLKRGDLQ
jgi:hypothetical protein